MVAAKRHGVGFLEGCNILNKYVVPIDVGLVCFTLRFPMGKPTKLNHNSLAHHHDEALNPKLEGVAANDYRQARPTPELPCSERLMELWLWGGQAPHWNAYAKSQLRYILSGVACNESITP